MELTIKRKPDYFWYFNNGVTIICDEARQITESGRKHLRVRNGQIINGQQTTRVLAKHPNSIASIVVRVFVLPRQGDDNGYKYSEVVSTIVAATNWQNAIYEFDLKANDGEQVRLERDLRKFGYQYLRKRQSKGEARRMFGRRYAHFIKKETMAQSAAACLLDPYEVRLGKPWLFTDEIYRKIFDGRPAADYLTFYWLARAAAWYSQGYSGRGYAKWLVANFLWSELGSSLRRHEVRENFRHVLERDWKYRRQLGPLYSGINSIFVASMAFYRANRRSREGTLDESSFFKRRGLDSGFRRFWRSKRNRVRVNAEKSLRTFVQSLTAIHK